MKTFLYWAAVAVLCVWALAPLATGLWAGWLLFYEPPRNQTLQVYLAISMILSFLLIGPTILLVRYIWPRRYTGTGPHMRARFNSSRLHLCPLLDLVHLLASGPNPEQLVKKVREGGQGFLDLPASLKVLEESEYLFSFAGERSRIVYDSPLT